MDMQTTVVLMCAKSLMLGAPSETPTPPLGPEHFKRFLKDNLTPCKQAADCLQVLGQEQSRGVFYVFTTT